MSPSVQNEIATKQRLLSAALLLVSCLTAPANSHAATHAPEAQPQAQARQTLASFSTPRQLCSALERVGVSTRGWKTDGIDWSCSSEYHEIGRATGSLRTNVAYYVIGDTSDRAHTAKIVLNINDASTKPEGLRRVAEWTNALAESTIFRVPQGFLRSIESGLQTETDVGGVRYAVELETTRINTYHIIISDAPALDRKDAARASAIQGAAALFESCKDVLARDLEYPRATLSGDGEPIQEEGYQSFMLEGRNGDLFFCKVHPDGTYKITAAFARKFPFRPVASGKL